MTTGLHARTLATPVPPPIPELHAPLTPEALARYQNHTYFLQGLAVRISLEPDSARIAGFRKRVLEILRAR